MTFLRITVLCFIATMSLASLASAQWIERPRTGSSQSFLPDRTNMVGMSGMAPQLEVALIDSGKNAAEKKAVVEVEVWGVDLVEPQASQQPKLTQACVTYQLDSGEVIRTAEKEHTFTGIAPGYHHIYVQLSAVDGQPVGARLTVTVHIPK